MHDRKTEKIPAKVQNLSQTLCKASTVSHEEPSQGTCNINKTLARTGHAKEYRMRCYSLQAGLSYAAHTKNAKVYLQVRICFIFRHIASYIYLVVLQRVIMKNSEF